MEIAVKTLFVGLIPEICCQKKKVYFHSRVPYSQRGWLSAHMTNVAQEITRAGHKFRGVHTITAGLENADVSTSPFKDFRVAANKTCDDREIKVKIDVSGEKTQVIFDDVFSKLVAAAQPIPGFRRVKGGKTPDIPKDILLHILGPSKVNKQSIKKIINSTVAEYVEKEGLRVTKDLRVEQSSEELEATFVPGNDFSFDAIIQLQETDTNKY